MVDGEQLAQAALDWYDAGCSVLPVRPDGSKAPLFAWRGLQQRRPPRAAVRRWFVAGDRGIAVVCGGVSGGLELLELEGRTVEEGVASHLIGRVAAAGLTGLWTRITRQGYAERTPSGGLHLLYRVTDAPVPPNTRLAARPATHAELDVAPHERLKVLAETRGEGGYVVVAPSGGTVHPSGQPWVALYGSTPHRLPTLTFPERQALVAVVRQLDAMPHPGHARTPRRTPNSRGGLAPGEDFDQRIDWGELLVPAGWTFVRRAGRSRLWRRPGKATGVSASTGYAADRDRLYIFSTSTPFEAGQPVSKFHFYAVTFHAGDHGRAARALRDAGYGTRAQATAS